MVSKLRQLAKQVLPFTWQKKVKKVFHKAGLYIWPSMNFEFWCILQNLLHDIEPRNLVEFGSGRSTNFLAEYSLKSKVNFISFEQNYSFYRRIKKALILFFLPDDVIVHAPIRGNWYDPDIVSCHLNKLGSIDFLLVDGPAEFDFGNRDAAAFDETVVPHLEKVKLIIVDDVDCVDCHQMAVSLAEQFDLLRFDMSYNERNILALLLHRDVASAIERLPKRQRQLLVPAIAPASGATAVPPA